MSNSPLAWVNITGCKSGEERCLHHWKTQTKNPFLTVLIVDDHKDHPGWWVISCTPNYRLKTAGSTTWAESVPNCSFVRFSKAKTPEILRKLRKRLSGG